MSVRPSDRAINLLCTALALAPLIAAGAVCADTIVLDTGETFEAEVLEEHEDRIVVEHPLFGRQEIPRDKLKADEPERKGVFGTRFLRAWTRNFAAGFSGAQGNSQDANVNVALLVSREAESFRGLFESAYFYGSRDGDETTNEFFMQYNHDFLFSESRWYLFGTGRYAHDEFQSWEDRITAQGGVGYEFVKRKRIAVRGTIGAGVAQTFGIEDRTTPEGVVGIYVNWIISDVQKFDFDTVYFPNFNDISEFRLLSNAAYNLSLARIISGLGLRGGLKNEYDTLALGEQNNLKYFINLAYDF